MAAINLGRMGRKDLRWVRLSHYVLVFLIVAVLRIGMKTQGSQFYWLLGLVVNIGYARHFYDSQRRLYDAYQARGGRRASIRVPLLLCLLAVLLLLGLAFWGAVYSASR